MGSRGNTGRQESEYMVIDKNTRQRQRDGQAIKKGGFECTDCRERKKI